MRTRQDNANRLVIQKYWAEKVSYREVQTIQQGFGMEAIHTTAVMDGIFVLPANHAVLCCLFPGAATCPAAALVHSETLMLSSVRTTQGCLLTAHAQHVTYPQCSQL